MKWSKEEVELLQKELINCSTYEHLTEKTKHIAEKINKSPEAIRRKAYRLGLVKNELIEEVKRLRKALESLRNEKSYYTIPSGKQTYYRFGVVSDTHIGSLYADYEALTKFYKILKEEKIKIVLHAGDILDGHKVYKGHEFEVEDFGIEAQLKRLKDVYPRDIETKAITGNHDLSFKKQIGINVGQYIEMAVDNIYHIGEDYGNLMIRHGNYRVKIQLLHPGRQIAYSISYVPQKIIESMSGGEKPNLLLCGHQHSSMMLPCYRNVFALQSGTFQSQTSFMRRKGLPAHKGGWIVEINFKGKLSSRFKAEFIAFYEGEET